MLKTNIKNFLFFLAVAGMIPFLASCATSEEDSVREDGYEEMQKEIEAKKNPLHHLEAIRNYAMEQLNLTDKEIAFITTEEPKVLMRSDRMMIIYFWRGKNWYCGIEVVATPPPGCSPLLVKRIQKPTFP